MRRHLLCLPPLLLAAATACDAPADDGETAEGEVETAEGEGETAEGEGEGEGEGENGEGEGEGVTPLCIAEFCWELPLPSATTLQAVAVDGAGVVVGSDVGDVVRIEGAGVAASSSPLPFITGLVGGGTHPLWAAGGPVWRVGSAAPEVGLAGVFALHAFAPDNIWGVGSAVYHYDGVTWLPDEISGTTSMLDVHGTSATDLWAVGLDRVRHRTAAGWQDVAVPTSSSLQAVWANAADDVWAAGDAGKALHFDGATWTSVDLDDFVSITDLRGFAADDVWATCSLGVLHWDGTAWSLAFSPGHSLVALDGTADNLWGVGSNGYVAHFDGTTWARHATGGSDLDVDVIEVSVDASGTTLALGRDFATNQPRLLTRTAAGWVQGTIPVEASPISLLALEDDQGLVVGYGGIWRGSGSAWEAEGLPVRGAWRDACRNGGSEWVAGIVSGSGSPGESFTLLRHTNAWRAATRDTNLDTFVRNVAVWCTGDDTVDDVWAQADGAHWHNTVDGLVRTDTAAFARLSRAAAFAPDNAWAIVNIGGSFSTSALAFHYDGVEWASVVLPGDDIPVDVTGSNDNVWIQGQRSAWRIVDGEIAAENIATVGGPLPDIRFADMLDDGSVMLLGDGDSVWHLSDGAAVEVVEGGFASRMTDAVFIDAAQGFAADNGVYELVDGEWTAVRGVSTDVTKLWRTADDDIWAVGDRVWHFDGTTWTEAFTPDSFFERFVDVWASGPNDVWIVGDQGSLLHKTAAGFVSLPPSAGNRMAVFGSDPDDVWFVSRGSGSRTDDVIIERKGAGSALIPLSLPGTLVTVQRVGDVVMAADTRGGVWRRTATSGWQEMVAPQEPDVFNTTVLTDLQFTAEDAGIAVMNGTLGEFIGDGFVQQPSNLFVSSVAGAGNDVYLLSMGGVLRRQPD